MAILAANCPCCGRDIGFEEGVKEYTCIFCGAKLITATLVKERLDNGGNAGYERYRKGDALDAAHHSNAGLVVRERERTAHHDRPQPQKTEQSAEQKPAEQQPEKPEVKEEPKKEPELTEEEIRVQLMRKAEYKQELRDVVKEIDTLRSRRERFILQLKSCKRIMILGLVFVALAVGVMVIPDGILFNDAEEPSARLIAGGGLAVIGLVTLIISETKKNGVKKQQKKLEEDISEKKDHRDGLIGRLNKINKRLHIHSDDEEG